MAYVWGSSIKFSDVLSSIIFFTSFFPCELIIRTMVIVRPPKAYFYSSNSGKKNTHKSRSRIDSMMNHLSQFLLALINLFCFFPPSHSPNREVQPLIREIFRLMLLEFFHIPRRPFVCRVENLAVVSFIR